MSLSGFCTINLLKENIKMQTMYSVFYVYIHYNYHIARGLPNEAIYLDECHVFSFVLKCAWESHTLH